MSIDTLSVIDALALTQTAQPSSEALCQNPVTLDPTPNTQTPEHPNTQSSAALWQSPVALECGGLRREMALTNFAGRVYPTLHNDLMAALLEIGPEDRVLDVGGGDSYFPRADVVTDAFPDSNEHRSGRAVAADYGHRRFVPCFAESLPFADHEFDFAYCRMVLEHVDDPAAACRELQRVARRGFIETPSPIAEYLGGHPTHRWLVWVERLPGQEPTLVFQRKPFRRAPLRYALRRNWFTDPEFQYRWEFEYRNVVTTQFEWSGEFRFRVEEHPEGIDYDDPRQAAEAHLDATIHGLAFGGVPAEILLPDAEQASRLCPDWALTHNTRGCALWLAGRYNEALAAFGQAARLEPNCTQYSYNARLTLAQAQTAAPHLMLLPPALEEREETSVNFAGKIYHAFLNQDDRLARDLEIRPEERVLDVGGGQRPLARADVSIDYDVFDGLHRQGQAISRAKPLVCGDTQRLPFRDRAFDMVCCRMVLEHVLDPAAACHELQRVARRGFIETPNVLWECFYGHPTHRWVITWEPQERILTFKRKPFDRIPFLSAIVPYLYLWHLGGVYRGLNLAFETNFRNITTTQLTWDEDHPFAVVVEDDPDCPYDYLNRPEDAARGSIHYVRDLRNYGNGPTCESEADDAIRLATTPEQKREALQLRLSIARDLQDRRKCAEIEMTLRALQRAEEKRIMGATARPGATGAMGTQRDAANLAPQHAVAAERVATGPAPLLWQAPLRDPSGYADEARHFLFALDAAGIDVAAGEFRWSDKVASLPPARRRTLDRLMRRQPTPNPVYVAHILAPHFQRPAGARACVGRTMFETDRLPEGWADACNRMDAVWVPGHFNVETFTRAGVQPEKLRIVPGAIDLSPYDPGCAPLQISGARGFNFLSVFDWTLRKGWDALIRAFVEEFRPDEDVALILKTHSSLGYTGAQLIDQISTFLTRSLGRDPNRIPDIVLQDANVPDDRMPNLYRAADCYVMPSRGEGWGRPYMEAMAMALPTIATNWSGQTAFVNAENALLLDYELVDVPETAWRETPTYRGHRWAEPSLSHLRRLLRQAFEDRQGGREIGGRARAHLEQRFTYAPVAAIIASELERLA
jgi:ubiquinone/menaquinone biosynthesis C-methylase UbiE/glycosyltransferase involved in cell wall biosynthesis